MKRSVLAASILLMTFQSTIMAAWMPAWSNSLFDATPSTALLTNLLAGINERTLASYSHTATSGVEVFTIPPLSFITTNISRDFSSLIVCGLATQTWVEGGVTNRRILTNMCPTVTTNVLTNAIANVPPIELMNAIDSKIEALIPLFLVHTNAIGGDYNNYLSTNKTLGNVQIPYWNKATLFSFLGVGTIISNNIFGGVWDARWTAKPSRTNQVILARALPVFTEYIAVAMNDTNGALKGKYTLEANFVYRSGANYIAKEHDSLDRYYWALSGDDIFDAFFDFTLDGFMGESLFRPSSSDYIDIFSLFDPTGLYYNVSAVLTNATHGMQQAYSGGDRTQAVDPSAALSNAFPVYRISLVNTSFPPDAMGVLVEGFAYSYATSGVIGSGATIAKSESLTLSQIYQQSAVKWVWVTNFVVTGTTSNNAEITLAYTNAQAIYANDFNAKWYREALVERYKVVNALKHSSFAGDQYVYFADTLAGRSSFGVACGGPAPTNSGYSSYVFGGLSVSTSEYLLAGGLLPRASVLAGKLSELDIIETSLSWAERHKEAHLLRPDIESRLFFTTQSVDMATVQFYHASTLNFLDSDGFNDTNVYAIQLGATSSVMLTPGSGESRTNHAAYYSGGLVNSIDETTVSAHMDAMTNLNVSFLNIASNLVSIIGCSTNDGSVFNELGGVWTSIRSRSGYPVIVWDFENQD